jgi:hypothetical protein
MPLLVCTPGLGSAWSPDGGADDLLGTPARRPPRRPAATFGLLHPVDAPTARTNLGMYASNCPGRSRTSFHCTSTTTASGTPLHPRKAVTCSGTRIRRGERLPYAANCPLPPSVSEMQFAGF